MFSVFIETIFLMSIVNRNFIRLSHMKYCLLINAKKGISFNKITVYLIRITFHFNGVTVYLIKITVYLISELRFLWFSVNPCRINLTAFFTFAMPFRHWWTYVRNVSSSERFVCCFRIWSNQCIQLIICFN